MMNSFHFLKVKLASGKQLDMQLCEYLIMKSDFF